MAAPVREDEDPDEGIRLGVREGVLNPDDEPEGGDGGGVTEEPPPEELDPPPPDDEPEDPELDPLDVLPLLRGIAWASASAGTTSPAATMNDVRARIDLVMRLLPRSRQETPNLSAILQVYGHRQADVNG